MTDCISARVSQPDIVRKPLKSHGEINLFRPKKPAPPRNAGSSMGQACPALRGILYNVSLTRQLQKFLAAIEAL